MPVAKGVIVMVKSNKSARSSKKAFGFDIRLGIVEVEVLVPKSKGKKIEKTIVPSEINKIEIPSTSFLFFLNEKKPKFAPINHMKKPTMVITALWGIKCVFHFREVARSNHEINSGAAI
jgi:hypothetical protein